jgi:S-adenosylmethionine:tRNA ribosyltransferase-isomerase
VPFWHLQFHNLLNANDISAFLQKYGHTPLPPYIHTQDSDFVRKRYQTVYAQKPGSVAAPTAGLHFTPQLLEKLRQKGVNIAHVTLHVGAGTFQNPTPEQLLSGKLHAEHAELPPETAKKILETKQLGGEIVAVGTTALRTLETWGQKGKPLQGLNEETSIFIRPGYTFQVVDKLITNFHLPGSSLLMLVEAFIGPGIHQLYQHAIAKNFRFYSFGDTSLLTRQPTPQEV